MTTVTSQHTGRGGLPRPVCIMGGVYVVRYAFFVGILAVAATFLSGAAMAALDVEILLEAELANKIQGPLVTDTPEDVKAFDPPVVPDEPSNGKFIWAPGKPVTGGGGSGFAEFIIDIPKAGKYVIWGRVIAWDGNSDSFWVTWEPADPTENPQQTQNTQYRWGVASGPSWHSSISHQRQYAHLG
jgi:hypothetical protein